MLEFLTLKGINPALGTVQAIRFEEHNGADIASYFDRLLYRPNGQLLINIENAEMLHDYHLGLWFVEPLDEEIAGTNWVTMTEAELFQSYAPEAGFDLPSYLGPLKTRRYKGYHDPENNVVEAVRLTKENARAVSQYWGNITLLVGGELMVHNKGNNTPYLVKPGDWVYSKVDEETARWTNHEQFMNGYEEVVEPKVQYGLDQGVLSGYVVGDDDKPTTIHHVFNTDEFQQGLAALEAPDQRHYADNIRFLNSTAPQEFEVAFEGGKLSPEFAELLGLMPEVTIEDPERSETVGAALQEGIDAVRKMIADDPRDPKERAMEMLRATQPDIEDPCVIGEDGHPYKVIPFDEKRFYDELWEFDIDRNLFYHIDQNSDTLTYMSMRDNVEEVKKKLVDSLARQLDIDPQLIKAAHPEGMQMTPEVAQMFDFPGDFKHLKTEPNGDHVFYYAPRKTIPLDEAYGGAKSRWGTKRECYPDPLQEMIFRFHRAFRAPAANMPRPIGLKRGILRTKMLREELQEFSDAVGDGDIVEQYDALLDLLVLAFGGLVEMGLDAKPGFEEVHRANMSKLGDDGKPIVSRGEELDGFPKGKILKGPDYIKPDLFKVLVDQGWVPEFEDFMLTYPEPEGPAWPDDPEIEAAIIKREEYITPIVQQIRYNAEHMPGVSQQKKEDWGVA